MGDREGSGPWGIFCTAWAEHHQIDTRDLNPTPLNPAWCHPHADLRPKAPLEGQRMSPFPGDLGFLHFLKKKKKIGVSVNK